MRHLIFVFFLLPIGLSAQVMYISYDNAGNRIQKSLTANTVNAAQADSIMQAVGIPAPEEVFGEEGIQEVKVYPNPVQEVLIIELPEMQATTRMELWNMEGKKLMDQTISSHSSVQVASLPSGVYLLRLKTGTTYLPNNWRITKN